MWKPQFPTYLWQIQGQDDVEVDFDTWVVRELGSVGGTYTKGRRPRLAQ